MHERLGSRGWSGLPTSESVLQTKLRAFSRKLEVLFPVVLIYLWSVALLHCFRKGLNTAASTTSLQKQMRHLWSCHTLSPMQSAKRCKTHFWVRWHSGHLSTSGRSKAKANKLKTSEDTDTIIEHQWNEQFCHILPCSACRLCTNRASRHRFPFLIRYGAFTDRFSVSVKASSLVKKCTAHMPSILHTTQLRGWRLMDHLLQ